MTIAHIAWQYGLTNTGGAALSASRLHYALRAKGVDSHYICVYDRDGGDSSQTSESGFDLNIHQLPRGFSRKIYLHITRLIRGVWRLTPYRKSIFTHIVPLFGLERELERIKPDIVHVQWINSDVCTFEQLSRIVLSLKTGKLPLHTKFVFNLHDLYMLLGFDVHPGDDPRFAEGFTRANSSFVERWVFNRKRRLIETVRPTFIADSKWVESICRRSLIGASFPVHTIYDLPDPIFLNQTFDCRNLKGRNGSFRLLFGCFGGLTNRFKGFPDLLKAFEQLSSVERKGLELRVFGSKDLAATEVSKCERLGVKVLNLGIPSNADLPEYYRSSDLFVFPSVKETLGMTKIEALLCGTPVVAFDRTACAEGIVHKVTGWVAPDGDCGSFAEGIRYFMNNPTNRSVVAAEAVKAYSLRTIVGDVLKVYTDCLLRGE